ncbi:FAD-binding oxidoreductase [Rhodoferax sp. GW822-FHT02A01]|uniref:NAD(P)/FAD-dependent oxidoreductase n=1 Tax=Rhodoferax sp. GW822-FHT02A01 TaxID=3141537 RepID=UPI00315D61EC
MGSKHVIVIGSGILGASTAWHLVQAGARVTILEAAEPGGMATRDSWAWLNASWGNPEPYFRLRIRSMQEWKRLQQQVAQLQVQWSGGLLWDLPPDALEAYAGEHSAWGYGIERVDAARALQIEPAILQPPEQALYVAQEGSVDPLAAAMALLAGAQDGGAQLLAHTPATGLRMEQHRVIGVDTPQGLLEADEVVLAAGIGSAALLNDLGLHYRIDAPPGLLVHSKPTIPLLRTLLMTPDLHVRQTTQGRLVAGTDYAGDIAGADPRELARQLHGKVQAMVRGAEQLEMDFYTLGRRPTPGDGFPMVGRPSGLAGLYLVLSHSGITLAPALGLFAAAELLQGVRDPLLIPYQPDRLLQNNG